MEIVCSFSVLLCPHKDMQAGRIDSLEVRILPERVLSSSSPPPGLSHLLYESSNYNAGYIMQIIDWTGLERVESMHPSNCIHGLTSSEAFAVDSSVRRQSLLDKIRLISGKDIELDKSSKFYFSCVRWHRVHSSAPSGLGCLCCAVYVQ